MSNSLTSGARQILMAAEPLFAASGYDGVSMQQIARAAGISKANIYHHFRSKDELYWAVLKDACQDMVSLLAELNTEPSPSEERLASFASEHLKHLNHKPDISRLILRELVDGSSERGRELVEKVFGEHFARLVDLIRSGQKAGALRDDVDPDHMAVALAGLNVFLFQMWPAIQHFPGEAFHDQEASGRIMFELLFNGLAHQGGDK